MLNRRAALGVLATIGAAAASGASFAKGPHRHHDGHNALGAKLKQNGKHQVGKAGKETVLAEVNNGKVVGMTAGSLPVKKVKTTKKMAGLSHSNIQTVSARTGEQFAQSAYEEYYGYGFDTGAEEEYYWYPASDVNTSDVWVVYVLPA